MRIRHLKNKFPLPVLHPEHREGTGNNLLAGTAMQRLLINIVGEVHVGMRLIREEPLPAFLFQDDNQVISIVKHERGKYAETLGALGGKPNLCRDVLKKVLLYCLKGHCGYLRKKCIYGSGWTRMPAPSLGAVGNRAYRVCLRQSYGSSKLDERRELLIRIRELHE